MDIISFPVVFLGWEMGFIVAVRLFISCAHLVPLLIILTPNRLTYTLQVLMIRGTSTCVI